MEDRLIEAFRSLPYEIQKQELALIECTARVQKRRRAAKLKLVANDTD